MPKHTQENPKCSDAYSSLPLRDLSSNNLPVPYERVDNKQAQQGFIENITTLRIQEHTKRGKLLARR